MPMTKKEAVEKGVAFLKQRFNANPPEADFSDNDYFQVTKKDDCIIISYEYDISTDFGDDILLCYFVDTIKVKLILMSSSYYESGTVELWLCSGSEEKRFTEIVNKQMLG